MTTQNGCYRMSVDLRDNNIQPANLRNARLVRTIEREDRSHFPTNTSAANGLGFLPGLVIPPPRSMSVTAEAVETDPQTPAATKP